MGAGISSISILNHGVAGVLFAACLAVIPPAVGAEVGEKPDSAAEEAGVAVASSLEESLYDYSKYTHHQLTELGARWDELEDSERRALLQEVKLRMARQKGSERVLQIRTQRRYGRIVRRSDGKVLRIETQVVQVSPVNPHSDSPEQSFGVGFERRSATASVQQPSTQVVQSQSDKPSARDRRSIPPALRASNESQ